MTNLIKCARGCGRLAMAQFQGTEEMLCDDCGREVLYEVACARESDINEHLPLLRKLAEDCEHVTEFGMRWARGSTVAFLAAQPKVLVSWDLSAEHVVHGRVDSLVKLRGETQFQPRTGDTLQIRTEPTDMLFIDTLHTGKQLIAELERHVDPRTWPMPVRKYLAFHDTKTFALVGEDGQAPGLYQAIMQFQKYHAFPHWETLHNLDNNNGLIVLGHICRDGHSVERVNGHCKWCALPAGPA